MGMLKRRASSQGQPQTSSNPGKKRRRCSGCEGSERVGKPHYILRGDLFCGVCIKKQKRTPPKKAASAKVDPATADSAPVMANTAATPATTETVSPPASAGAAAADPADTKAALSLDEPAAVQEARSTPMATAAGDAEADTEADTESTQPTDAQAEPQAAAQPEESLDEKQAATTESQEETELQEVDTQSHASQGSEGHMPRTNTLQLFDDTPTSTPTPSTPPAQTIEDGSMPMEEAE